MAGVGRGGRRAAGCNVFLFRAKKLGFAPKLRRAKKNTRAKKTLLRAKKTPHDAAYDGTRIVQSIYSESL